MPDAWLNEEELKAHEEEVKNHPLTKQAEEAREAHEKDAEELAKQQAENRKKVEAGELEEVRANGAVTGYREAGAGLPDDEEAREVAELFQDGVKPKEEGRGGATEGELGPVTGSPPAVGGADATPREAGAGDNDPEAANRDEQKESRASAGGKASNNSEEEAKTSRKGSGSKADKEGQNK
jgi:hypothetical protein